MKNFTLILLCLFMAAAGWSQTARVQIIHNSPSPTVDIWAGSVPLLTNVEFRTASPYIDVPANVTLDIGVAPSPSTSTADIIATFSVQFEENRTYAVIASGIVGDATTPFTLNIIEDTRESAAAGGVDFVVNHGSTDAPTVDVIARGVATLVDDASYGDVTPYINVPAGAYTLDVTPGNLNSEIVASFSADLSGLEGGAAVVFASGFLAPPMMGDPAFGIFAALPDGTVVEFPAVQNSARLQVIHNSASPTVDIWVNDTPLLTNFEYRTATPYIDVPAGTTLNIGVAPSPSTSTADIIATFPVNFTPGETYVAIASGIVGNATTPFTLNLVSGAREAAAAGGVDFVVNHGSTDAPIVDVIARGVATLVDDASYGDVTPYINVPAGAYTLDVTPGDANSEIVASFSADLSGLEGGAAVVFASGFLAPPMMGDPAFGIFAALPDGTVVEFPAVQNSARLQVIHNSASPTVDIWVNDTPLLTNFEYRTAHPAHRRASSTNFNIGVAPSQALTTDIIATFPVNFTGETYVAISFRYCRKCYDAVYPEPRQWRT
ncbi:MAG: DUF4397 domain-containing protein [Saprospiraceae bacterium]